MPSFKEYGLLGIKKHPDIFSALEEFERTKKIPKFTYRQRLDITIDETLLKKFKNYCQDHGYTMSRVIEKWIKEEMEKEK